MSIVSIVFEQFHFTLFGYEIEGQCSRESVRSHMALSLQTTAAVDPFIIQLEQILFEKDFNMGLDFETLAEQGHASEVVGIGFVKDTIVISGIPPGNLIVESLSLTLVESVFSTDTEQEGNREATVSH